MPAEWRDDLARQWCCRVRALPALSTVAFGDERHVMGKNRPSTETGLDLAVVSEKEPARWR
jgi:hypothetical protein